MNFNIFENNILVYPPLILRVEGSKGKKTRL